MDSLASISSLNWNTTTVVKRLSLKKGAMLKEVKLFWVYIVTGLKNEGC